MPSLLQALTLTLTGSFSAAHMVRALKTEFAQAQCYHVRPQCGDGIELPVDGPSEGLYYLNNGWFAVSRNQK